MKTFLTTPVARVLIALVLVPASPVSGRAQTGPRDLARVSIEDLMKIEITSAAKKEQRAEDVPAAVFVITQDDIRRSGLRSLPELFRLVPGCRWRRSIREHTDAKFSHGICPTCYETVLGEIEGG